MKLKNGDGRNLLPGGNIEISGGAALFTLKLQGSANKTNRESVVINITFFMIIHFLILIHLHLQSFHSYLL